MQLLLAKIFDEHDFEVRGDEPLEIQDILLNGDGKTNVIKDDSLEHIDRYVEKYDILTCNPPFGTKILEKRPKVLRQYDLGFE